MKPKRTIFLVGLFLSDKNKHLIMRTAADQLAELLKKNNYSVLTTSIYLNKFIRYIDTIWKIFINRKKYKIAVIPLYGSVGSYIWEETASIVLHWLNKKVILIVHGGSIPGQMNETPGKFIKTLKRAEIVVCPSNYILTSLKSHGVESRLIENVINLNDYLFHEKKEFRPRILWMRTLEDIYNPEMAIRVLSILIKKFPDTKLVMAGFDRGSKQMIIDLANELNVIKNVEFPGYVNNEQKNKYAQDLDFYICTNRIDNAPVSLIEMMALGLPVITVDSGGIPYLISNNENGILIKLDDDEAMANAIENIIQNPEIGIKLINNGLQFAKSFGEESVIVKWENTFEELNHIDK
jgi:glycosyltransferase involved in cell wall biosynthesis